MRTATKPPIIHTILYNETPTEETIIKDAEAIKTHFRKAYLFQDKNGDFRLDRRRYLPNRDCVFVKAY